MVPLARTEVIWLQDELKKVRKTARSPMIIASCDRMLSALDLAVERRKKQIDQELKTE